jgi:hypothetical protein
MNSERTAPVDEATMLPGAAPRSHANLASAEDKRARPSPALLTPPKCLVGPPAQN